MLILLISLFPVLYLPYVQAGRATEALEAKGRSVTQLVAHDIQTAYEFGDIDMVQDVFAGALADPDLRFIVLLDEKGERFAADGQEPMGLFGDAAPEVGLLVDKRIESLALTVPVAGTAARLSAVFGTERILRQRRADQVVALALGGLILAAGLLASYLVVQRSLRRPLKKAAEVARRLAVGDLDVEIRNHSVDEIGELLEAVGGTIDYMRDMSLTADAIAKGDLRVQVTPRAESDRLGSAFGKMVAGLRAMVEEILDSSQAVSESAREISSAAEEVASGGKSQSTSTDETSTTMVEMASQIDSISTATGKLASRVGATTTSVQQISSSIGEVARGADDLISSVEETATTIEQMTASINSVAERVEFVEEVTKATASETDRAGQELPRLIETIGAASTDVGKIAGIIKKIAHKTKLVALNAAIQASHAGAHSKGFTAVAGEVKDLALRTQESTVEINDFIEGMQSSTGEAIALVHELVTRLIDSVGRIKDLVGEVHTATQEQTGGATLILQGSTRMKSTSLEVATEVKKQAERVSEIRSAVETMNESTKQVAESLVEQRKGGEQVVDAVTTIAQIAQQNLSASDRLSDATDSLAREAVKLQAVSSAFRI
ncbi:MAG: methyl-accepting chemotaxis protein [Acidobacteriota bacterium]|nr:methyl-accepting chemotaxis protein [Acidobacteriota bacterium]